MEEKGLVQGQPANEKNEEKETKEEDEKGDGRKTMSIARSGDPHLGGGEGRLISD